METTKNLFGPAKLGNIQLKNRVVMAPMTRSRAIGNLPNDLIATYYAQRASAGLIITEGTAPSPNGLGYARIPGIFTQQQQDAWAKVTKAVHEKGGKIILQLMHVGRIAHSANMPEGARIIGPSAIAANADMWTDTAGMQKTETPEAMTLQDIKHTISEFAEAAKRGIAAGFDGVELHGANGYLLEQFLNPHVNTRTDEYGGSIENRCRFVLEVTNAVAAAIGKEKTAIRLSPYSTYNDLPAYNEVAGTYGYLSKELQKAGILYLHLVDYAARASEEGLQLIDTIRANFSNALILNAGYTKERAEKALNWGADFISFGTPFISNPDLPKRMEQNLELTTPDPSTFYTADATGYTDYAFSTERK